MLTLSLHENKIIIIMIINESLEVIGFSVLALDGCGLGQGEGELSVKELWLDIREKVTEELTNLLSDR